MSVPKQTYTLRSYQDAFVRYLVRHLLNGAPEVALESTTGSGKTLTAQAVASLLTHTDLFKSVLIAAPQVAIEAGFDIINPRVINFPNRDIPYISCQEPVFVEPHEWLRLRDSSQGAHQCKRILAAHKPQYKVMLTTHQALAHWSKNGLLPRSLKGRLLIIDEAHHLGSLNAIGKLVKKWIDRGGHVLHLSATLFRRDHTLIVDPGAPRCIRTMADQATDGFAPKFSEFRTEALGLTAKTDMELIGSLMPSIGSQTKATAGILQRWEDDGRPKVVVRVPAKGSLQWSQQLEREFKKTGARVLNVVGMGQGTKTRLEDALASEREVPRYKDSKIDVILACKRFDEGSDWPLCSHFYYVGVSSSLGLVLQMWGRTTRLKTGIQGYPSRHENTASMTFFVPGVTKDGWEKFKPIHKDYTFLLAAYMADVKTAQDYTSDWTADFRKKHGHRVPMSEMLDDLREEVKGFTGTDISSQALRYSAQAELSLRAMKVKPTVKNVVRYLQDTLKRPSEEVQEVKNFWAVRTLLSPEGEEIRFKLMRRLKWRRAKAKNKNHVVLQSIIREECREAFDEVLKKHDKTIAIADEVVKQVGKWTGRDAKSVAQDLQERLHYSIFLTLKDIKKGILKYFKEHGKRPSIKSGDASKYYGFLPGTITWAGVASQLRSQGSSLLKLCIEMGLEINTSLTLEDIKKGILKYFKEHGKVPTAASGDASKYYGFQITWRSVYQRLRGTHGYTLLKLCIEMGLEVDSSLTLEDIKKGILKYFKEHGKRPSIKSGDASKYYGFRITWTGIDCRLRKMGSSLSKFCIEMALKSDTSSLTLEDIKKGILKYFKEHGKRPSSRSGDDASKYYGFLPGTITWAGVTSQLRSQGSSFSNLFIEMGLEVDSSLIQEGIKKAIFKYFKEHGKRPSSKSGDASKYYEFLPGTITWEEVDTRLRYRGPSLLKLCIEMGLEVDSSLTLEDIKKGILKYFKEHGKVPKQKSGDASKYYGFLPGTIKWAGVEQRLLHQGSSLLKLCIEMGLSINTSLTLEDIKKGILKYFKEHGKRPSSKSGDDASKYYGFRVAWKNINARLRSRGSSLSKFCIEMALKSDTSSLTQKDIKKAILKYFKEHGKVPKQKSGDASKYCEFRPGIITWSCVQQRLLHQGSSLSKLYVEMGLKTEGKLS